MTFRVPFNTVNHEHLDTVVLNATGDYPGSGLLLVECEDGQWFIEVDFGDDYDSIEGIFKPRLSADLPSLFDSREAAICFASGAMKQAHPEIGDQDLTEFFAAD